MLRLIQNAASRVSGAVVGGVVGFFSGAINGFLYRLHVGHVDEVGFVPTISLIIGAIKFTFKGIYQGATKGLMAAIHYRKEIHDYYFANIDKNNQLHEHLHNLRNNGCNLLTDDEIKKFEGHLHEINDEEEKNKLVVELEHYKNYINQECPLTKKRLFEYKDPVVLKNSQNTEITYSYSALCCELEDEDNIEHDWTTKFADGSEINKENMLYRGLPQRIINFVNEVSAGAP